MSETADMDDPRIAEVKGITRALCLVQIGNVGAMASAEAQAMAAVLGDDPDALQGVLNVLGRLVAGFARMYSSTHLAPIGSPTEHEIDEMVANLIAHVIDDLEVQLIDDNPS